MLHSVGLTGECTASPGKLAPVFAKPGAWRLLDIAIGCIMWTIAAGLLWERV